jgi:hypothetical protein
MINRSLASLVLLALLQPVSAGAQAVAVGQDRLATVSNVITDGTWRLYALLSDFQGRNDASVLLSEPSDSARATVATDGEHFLAAWAEGDTTSSDVRAAIVGGEELVLANNVAIPAHELKPIAGASGTGFFVLWPTPDGAGVAFISPAGVIEARRTIRVAGRVGAVVIGPVPVLLSVVDGEEISLQAIFLHSDWRPDRTVTIATIPVSMGGGSTYIADPQLAWNGNQFYVTWTAGRTGRYLYVEGTRLTADGAVLDVLPTCEFGPLGTCGTFTRRAGQRLYSGCCDFRSDALLTAGSRFVKTWQGYGRWS